MKIDVGGQFTPDRKVTHFATLPSHCATQKNPDEIVHRGHLTRINGSAQPSGKNRLRNFVAKRIFDMCAKGTETTRGKRKKVEGRGRTKEKKEGRKVFRSLSSPMAFCGFF